MQPDFAFLNDLDYPELRDWLREALYGRKPLPRVSPDEFPYLGIVRIESQLDKPTRRDMVSACQELVETFVQKGSSDVDYVRSLFGLAVKLQIEELSVSLADITQNTEKFSAMPLSLQRLILTTLVEFRTQSAEYWHSMLRYNQDAFAGVAFSGLFSSDPRAAIEILPQLPDRQTVGAAASGRIRRWMETLEKTERTKVAMRVREILNHCQHTVQVLIRSWLPVEVSPTEHVVKPSSGSSLPASNGTS